MRFPTDGEADRLGKVKARLMTSIEREITDGSVSKVEVLAIMAHVTGMLIAMQDQRTVSPEGAMEIVGANIESGNRSAIEQLFESGTHDVSDTQQ